MTKDEALVFDLALEALEKLTDTEQTYEALDLGDKAITAIKQARALDKMAENARELGLDYEPVDGTQVSKVWWDGEKLMAKPIPLEDFYLPAPVQEPKHIVHSNERYSPLLTRMMNKRVESNVKQVIHLYDEPPAQPAAPEGWKLVPVEPTHGMVKAFQDAMSLEFGMRTTAGYHARVYSAMLTAAPAAQPAPTVQPVAFEVGLVEWVGNKLMATPKVTTTPPASWMEMVTANLVREGVSKHKARELAEHFYGLAQRPFVGLTDEEIIKAVPGGIYDCLNDPWDCGVGDGDTLRSIKKDVLRIARAIEAKLKEKNNG
jgi:broad specificity phosphatase PhoE